MDDGVHERWMRAAIAQASEGLAAGQSPFGCVIVRDGSVIGSGHNEVWLRGDPTAHAEVVAIQRAARNAGTIDLAGCTLYTTCEPCPMCAAASHWAKVSTVVFGATIADAQRAGFSELTHPAATLYTAGGSPVRLVSGVLEEECAVLFAEWLSHDDRRTY